MSKKKEPWAQKLAKNPRLARLIPGHDTTEASARRELRNAKQTALAKLIAKKGGESQ